jgi:lipopolysaccharide cholinephosphotransferase
LAIDPTVLREAQLVMLDMLIEFHAICEKNDLIYWLDSGTLLGAVRHEGLIPWDDDIDISMPVEDYRKFAAIAKDALSKDVFFQNTQQDENFPFDYMKLRSNKVAIIEFHEADKQIDYHQGVFVDIFPMLAVRDGKLHRWYYGLAFKCIRFFSAKKHNILMLRKFFVWTLNVMHLGWEKENTKVIYSGKMPDIASQFDLSAIFPRKKISFEDFEFYGPQDPDHYLENIYDFDYMTIPPEEKRIIHAHEVIIH